MDKVDGDELACISCNADHLVLNKWVTSTTHLKGYIATNYSMMGHVAVVEAARTDGYDKLLELSGEKTLTVGMKC